MRKFLKYITIFVLALILPTLLASCGHKVKAQTSIKDYSNLDNLYLKIVNKMAGANIVTDNKSSYIAIDTSSMTGISSNGIKSIVSNFKDYKKVLTESFISLEEKGMRGSDGSLQGVLIYIERIKLTAANHLNIVSVAYNSNKKQVRYSFSITYKNGNWSLIKK